MTQPSIDDLLAIVEQTRKQSQQSNKSILIEMIQEKGISQTKQVNATYQKLDAAVKAKLDQLYSPHGKLSASIDYLSPSQKAMYQTCLQLEQKHPALAKWIWSIWSIPHYHAVGDVLGYGNSKNEFNDGNQLAGSEYLYVLVNRFIALGGVNDLQIRSWNISDDTIMYLLTIKTAIVAARTNLEIFEPGRIWEEIGVLTQAEYVSAIDQIRARGGGTTTLTYLANQRTIAWSALLYDSEAYGNGAAMRSGWIGAVQFCQDPRRSISEMNLIQATISAMITHNSAPGIWGSITATYFTTLAVTKIPISEWPTLLIKLIQSERVSDLVKDIKKTRYHREFLREQVIVLGQWNEYVRRVLVPWQQGREMAIMSDLRQRYQFLKDHFSKNRLIAGSGGDDGTIFSYDTLLRCDGSLEKVLILGCCHPGDSDTVGSIALSWFGAYYGSAKLDRYFNRWRGQLTELEEYDRIYDQTIRERAIISSYYSDLYLFWAGRLLVDLE